MSESASLDIAWLLVAAALVLVMQAGFLCLEAGATRSKNSINVAVKNLSDFAIASLLFAAFGYSVMFGPSHGGWFGRFEFIGTGGVLSGREAAFFVFEVMFCGTATTIVSGAVAERMRFGGYLLVAAVLSGLVYTVFGHWAWNGLNGSPGLGWLRAMGFVDFAGATVVHSVAGWSALAVVLILGPRAGRFAEDGSARRIQGHNLPFAMLGAILLWIGWLGFNGGSALAVDDRVPRILANTVLAGSAGLLAALTASRLRTGLADGMSVLNGSVAGLVSITAACHAVDPVGAVAIGAVGGVVMEAGTVALERARVDDVVGAIPAHAMAGVWGTLAVALFGDPASLGTGLGRAQQLGVQLLGAGVGFAWSFGIVYLIFRVADRLYPLRISPQTEHLGLNVAAHGATTELLDLLVGMERQARTGDLSLRVPVEPFTEVGQIASRYNQVMASLQEAVAKTEAVVRDIRDGIITFAEDGRLLSFNPGAERIFGYTFADVRHAPVSVLFSAPREAAGAQPPSALSAELQRAATGGGSPLALEGRRRDGRRLPLELTLSASEVQRETVYTGLVRDVSEREEMDRLKSEFVSTVSHELRTPLTAISASLGLMADGVVGELPAESRELVRIARDNSERLIRLIGDILDIEKMESGALAYDLQVLDVVELVERAVEANRSFAGEHGVTLGLRVDAPGARVRGDADRLIQVVTNLISNAVKFSPSDAEVTVSVARLGGAIRIGVRDHGPGIPADFRARVFEKFAQADASDSRKGGGTGLGLSICRAIVQAHGGRIAFETAEGGGASFYFEVPDCDGASRPDAPDRSAGP